MRFVLKIVPLVSEWLLRCSSISKKNVRDAYWRPRMWCTTSRVCLLNWHFVFFHQVNFPKDCQTTTHQHRRKRESEFSIWVTADVGCTLFYSRDVFTIMNINLTFSWIILIIFGVATASCVPSAARTDKNDAIFPRTQSLVELNRILIQMTEKKTDRREMDHEPTSEQHFRFKFLINFTEISDGDTFFFSFRIFTLFVFRLAVILVEVGKKPYCQTLICWHADHYVNIIIIIGVVVAALDIYFYFVLVLHRSIFGVE